MIKKTLLLSLLGLSSAGCTTVILDRNLYAYAVNNVSLSQLQSQCRQHAPIEYKYRRNLYDAYVNGCVTRHIEEIRRERLRIMRERQELDQELKRRAYEQGYDRSTP
jgi:hypothetical protein